jgi:hypothetical protein
VALNTVVADGIANGRQPSLLLVAVTNAGVAATVDLGGGALVPEAVPPVEEAPVVPEVEPVPVPLGGVDEPPEVLVAGGVVVPPDVLVAGGVVVPPEVLLAGGGVVLPLPAVEPVVGVSVVDPAEDAELLEPQALRAARQTIDIAERIGTRRFETKIIVTYSHSLPSDRHGMQVTRHNSRSRRQHSAVVGNPAICHPQTGSFAPPAFTGFALERDRVKHAKKRAALCRARQTYSGQKCCQHFFSETDIFVISAARNWGELSPFADDESRGKFEMRIVNAWHGKPFRVYKDCAIFFAHRTVAASRCM